MNYNKKTVQDVDVKGKKVLLRCDFNVPQDKETGAITSDKRIVAALPTIKYLLDNGAAVIAQSSAQSLAMLLGLISPKMSTTTVTTTVDSVAPASPKLFTNNAVARDAMAIFTMLLPIRMGDSSRSYRSSCLQTSAARRLPFSASIRSLVRFAEENAVSVAEK